MNDKIIWILITDAAEAKLYSTNQLKNDWSLVERFSDPVAREHNLEIVSDKPGRYRSGAGPKSAVGSRSEPHEIEIDNFAHKLAHYLNEGRANHAFGKLVIVALPRFYGQLRKHLDTHTERLIIKHIEKDYTHAPELEMVQMVRNHA